MCIIIIIITHCLLCEGYSTLIFASTHCEVLNALQPGDDDEDMRLDGATMRMDDENMPALSH